MTDSHARLLAARDVLNRAEQAVGLRVRDDIEQIHAGASPILLGPTNRSELIRWLIEACPSSAGSVISVGSGQGSRGWTSTAFLC